MLDRETLSRHTQEVYDHLVQHAGGPFEIAGMCAIGAAMLAARLTHAGASPFLVVGDSSDYGRGAHCWVLLGDLVADPTIGQFPEWEGLRGWHVGAPHEILHTRKAWVEIEVGNPYFEDWPEEQNPTSLECRGFVSLRDLQVLGLEPQLS